MTEVPNKFREPLNRPLTEQERDLVRWLLKHSHRDVSNLLPQIDRLSVASKCTCGCPSIEFSLDGEPVVCKGEELVSDWDAEVEGMPVYVQLWVRNGQITSLEVGSLPGSDKRFGLPAIESILGQ